MKVALVQMCASDDPVANLDWTRTALTQAKAGGADLVLTPEMTNCLSSDRSLQKRLFQTEPDDPTLTALRALAKDEGIWLLIGSLGLLSGDADGRFANRSFLIAPDGQIAARYDKMHMFDVDLGAGESFRESTAYRPGARAVLVDTPFGKIGLTICYDVRFPYLHRALAQAGADIITVPAAFAMTSGRAHWEVLLRARAIETGCFVLAPAQSGTHPTTGETRRESWGHSLVVSPWGEILLDAGREPGVYFAEIDLDEVQRARQRIPALSHDREVDLQ